MLFTNLKSSFCTALKSSGIHTTILLLNVNYSEHHQFPSLCHQSPSSRHWVTTLPPNLKEPTNPKQHNTWNFNHFPTGDQSWGSHWPGWPMTWFSTACVSVPSWPPQHMLLPGHLWEVPSGRWGQVLFQCWQNNVAFIIYAFKRFTHNMACSKTLIHYFS